MRRRGVTLIELLIAVSLLSLLVTGILMAVHLGFNSMERVNAKLIANRRAVRVDQILEQQIGGMMPETALCVVAPGAPTMPMAYFQGEPQSMRFVSTFSLQEGARGYPRILEFQVIPGENGRGVRLVVNERVYAGPLSTGLTCMGRVPDPAGGGFLARFRPIETGPASFVLADRLAFCNFAYRAALPAPLLEEWKPVWTRDGWPTAIHIEMSPLDPDASRVQLMPLTVPVRLRRAPMVKYED